VRRRNDEARRRAEILDANKDIEETNRALEDLTDYTRLMDSTASQRRSKLEDHYQPSDEMKRYAVLTMGIMGVGGAYGLTRIFLILQEDLKKSYVVRRKQFTVVAFVLLVTFPAESMSLNSTPWIWMFVLVTMNEKDVRIILLPWSTVNMTIVPLFVS
jgi:hypothetical protein